MKVKRFLADDMRKAMSQIRDELGPDAVILSSHRRERGGVEVVAVLNPEMFEPDTSSFSAVSGEFARLQREAQHNATTPYLDALKDQQLRVTPDGQSRPSGTSNSTGKFTGKSTTQSGAKSSRPQQNASSKPGSKPASKSGSTPGRQTTSAVPVEALKASRDVQAMRSELGGIRDLLQQRLSGLAWDQFVSQTPVQAHVWERLNTMGIPGFLNKQIINKLKPEYQPDEAWRFAIAWLSRSIPVLDTDPVSQGGIYALVGPTGVGKTTTIGKLATRYVLENGPESVALVTTDSFRIAAHEQLRTLGRILGVSVRIVDKRHSLQDTLNGLAHKSLILIDTAGLPAGNADLQEQLQALREQPAICKLLVLSCTSQAQVLRSAWKSYSTAGVSACILSRLDEAGALGDALALAIENKLPVVYETHGQSIPEDMRVAQAHRLVSRAVALGKAQTEYTADRERLATDFAGAGLHAPVPFPAARVG